MISRAKDKNTGFWREGYYACESNHACFGKELKYEHFIFVDEFMDWNIGGLQQYMVDPRTVGRFIGLYDKNGKKIFEGDYIVCRQAIQGNFIDEHIEKGYVEMKHGAFGLHRKQGWYRPFKDWLEDYEYEVIGNIHDNPELLEEGESDA